MRRMTKSARINTFTFFAETMFEYLLVKIWATTEKRKKKTSWMNVIPLATRLPTAHWDISHFEEHSDDWDDDDNDCGGRFTSWTLRNKIISLSSRK
mmetsp:Transcript_40644/g.69352  ORF Transcript_40644/g.69352 Transcript_40644/m.69352 type:complete len:96 (+) Transcript_40644:356-643(+)